MTVVPKFFLASLFITNVLALVFFFTILYPFQPVELIETIKTEKQVYKQGEPICLIMRFNKKMNIKPEVKYYLVNGLINELSGSSFQRPSGVNDVINCKEVPPVNPGVHHIDVNISYKVFPWRIISYSWHSEAFIIE